MNITFLKYIYSIKTGDSNDKVLLNTNKNIFEVDVDVKHRKENPLKQASYKLRTLFIFSISAYYCCKEKSTQT